MSDDTEFDEFLGIVELGDTKYTIEEFRRLRPVAPEGYEYEVFINVIGRNLMSAHFYVALATNEYNEKDEGIEYYLDLADKVMAERKRVDINNR